MKSIDLLENLEFNETKAHAQPLLANEHNRIMRFMLKPGQLLKEHQAPSSAVNIVIIQGRGIFSGAGESKELGPSSLIVFEPGEAHSVQALDQDLVFLLILKEAPDLTSSKPVGMMS
jgi:quercetin dioxygenase-like cupin family protein